MSNDIFLVAAAAPGTVGNVMPLLDGLSAQVKYELSKLGLEIWPRIDDFGLAKV